MTGAQSIHSDSADDAADMLATYRRIATMDPPALRSLSLEFDRLSDESSASAAVQATPAIQAKARRDAQRAAAARAALASVDCEG